MAKKNESEGRDRLAASLNASLPDSGGEYQVSSAYASGEKRRLLGSWLVDDHLVDGHPYIDSFIASSLRGASLIDPSYSALYDFREALCVKKVMISGLLDLPEGSIEYLYRMSVAISWEIGRGFLLVHPELGYQSTSLDGVPAAVKEFGSSNNKIRIGYRFEGDLLVLEEGLDSKWLKRGSTWA